MRPDASFETVSSGEGLRARSPLPMYWVVVGFEISGGLGTLAVGLGSPRFGLGLGDECKDPIYILERVGLLSRQSRSLPTALVDAAEVIGHAVKRNGVGMVS